MVEEARMTDGHIPENSVLKSLEFILLIKLNNKHDRIEVSSTHRYATKEQVKKFLS